MTREQQLTVNYNTTCPGLPADTQMLPRQHDTHTPRVGTVMWGQMEDAALAYIQLKAICSGLFRNGFQV